MRGLSSTVMHFAKEIETFDDVQNAEMCLSRLVAEANNDAPQQIIIMSFQRMPIHDHEGVIPAGCPAVLMHKNQKEKTEKNKRPKQHNHLTVVD